jgi:23S rRNA pseudouridine2605 synthase
MKKTQKIQKILAALGLGSRREIERWIEEGRIKINDQIATIGDRITGEEKIHVDGEVLRARKQPDRTRVLMYHKPAGQVCTRFDAEGRPTVFDGLPKLKNSRWVMVGRLDVDTSGLILFTNNGDVANTLMHPSGGFEREYMVRIFGRVSDDMIRRLLHGVKLPDGMANFKSIEDEGGTGANHWYRVVVTEGRNREVRRLWESQGVTVSRLMRVRFGKTKLPKTLKVRQHREFNERNVEKMLEAVRPDLLV